MNENLKFFLTVAILISMVFGGIIVFKTIYATPAPVQLTEQEQKMEKRKELIRKGADVVKILAQ